MSTMTMAKAQQEHAVQVVHGHVKWFDRAKGFGFVVSDETSADILLHVNVLRSFGQGSVAEGAGITLRAQQSQRGYQAIEVLHIEPPQVPIGLLGGYAATEESQELLALPLEPARIKWFDRIKGFGFATVFSHMEDVFIHLDVLRGSGFSDLQAGEAVCLRIVDGRRGRMAVQVVSWDASLSGLDRSPSQPELSGRTPQTLGPR